jgi:hypothetical protein
MSDGIDHIIVFEHRSFRGDHRHIFGKEADLGHRDDKELENRISSFVVLSGCWEFFKDKNFQNRIRGQFGPGEYEFVQDAGIPNDSISSLRSISGESNSPAEQQQQESSA